MEEKMDLVDLMVERVKIITEGEWSENQIKVEVNKKYTPKITEEMKKEAVNRFAARKAENPKLFDGPALHLNLKHSVIQPNCIFLALGETTYALYDIARKEYIEKYGWREFPMGTGVNAAVLTSDSQIVLHYRFPHIDFAAKIGTIGGAYEFGHPFDDMKREIEEEVAIKNKEIVKISLLGISHRLDERMNYELNFLVKVDPDKNQFKEREERIEEKEGKIFFLECSAKRVRNFLIGNHRNIASNSFACLVLMGRNLWGQNWSKINKCNKKEK